MTRFIAWIHASRRGDIAALAAGAILPLAFSPFDISPLAVLAPAVLFFLWLHISPGCAFRRGFLFGLGMFGAGVSWVYVSMYDYGHVGMLLSVFLTTLFVSVLALFPALLGYLLTRLFHRSGPEYQRLKLLLVFPAGWTLFEWLRGNFFSGFPWLNLGYSQTDSPLAGFAPILGVYGVSFLAALSAGLLLMSLRAGAKRGFYLAGLLVLWGSAGLLHTVSWTQPAGAPLKVALIQGNISQDTKWLPEIRDTTIDLYTQLTRAHWGNDLIVWPETALPAFYDEAREYLTALGEEARQNHTDMLIGLLYEDPQTMNYYNSMLSVGRKEGFYHKHHLVPFTEHLPLKTLFGGIVAFMDVPMSDFSAGGARQAPLEVAGQRAGISICFEDAFGEEMIRRLPDATLLVNVSNDAWFFDSIAPAQHLQMARMRALEAGRPLLRATNTGMTALIDARGSLQAVAPPYQVYVLNGKIQPMQGMTPYAYVSNWPVVIFVVAVLMWVYVIGRRRVAHALP